MITNHLSHKKQRSRKSKLLVPNFIRRFIFYLYVYPNEPTVPERMSGPLKLESQVVMSCPVWSWEWTHVFWEEQEVRFSTEPSF